VPDSRNPFDDLRREGELQGLPPGGGEEVQLWAFLGWMDRHSEALFGWPAMPAVDLTEGEVAGLGGTALDNALRVLPLGSRQDLECALPLGGVWTGLLGENRTGEPDRICTLATSGQRTAARERFLHHLLSTLAKGGDPVMLRVIGDIRKRWDGQKKSWLRRCLVRAEVSKAWQEMDVETRKRQHGRSSVEALAWVLHEIGALPDFVAILPQRVGKIYEEALAAVDAYWPEGRDIEVETLALRLAGRERPQEPALGPQAKASEIRTQLKGIPAQPSLEQVPDVLTDLEVLQKHHVTGRQAIQACTACLLWIHRKETEGSALLNRHGDPIRRWEVQLLLLHHLMLNGSLARARTVLADIQDALPASVRVQARRLLEEMP